MLPYLAHPLSHCLLHPSKAGHNMTIHTTGHDFSAQSFAHVMNNHYIRVAKITIIFELKTQL